MIAEVSSGSNHLLELVSQVHPDPEEGINMGG